VARDHAKIVLRVVQMWDDTVLDERIFGRGGVLIGSGRGSDFGTADPHAYGIDFRKVLLFLDLYPDAPASRPGAGRYLAVSATLLAGAYLDADRAFARESLRRGLVQRAAIDEYLTLAASHRPTFPDWLISRGLITQDQRRDVDDALPSSWITHIRDTQQPIAWAGDSIAIYRVE